MADNAALLTDYQDFLFELQGGRQVLFPAEFPLLAELSGSLQAGGVDPGYRRYTRGIAELAGDRETFHGSKVRFSLQLNDVPGAHASTETSTWTVPAPFDTDQATLTLAQIVQPIAVSLALERDARNGATAAMESVAAYTESAYRQVARVENDFLHGGGDALLASSTSANSDSDGLTMTVLSTTNWDQLTPGRVVSVLVKADGTDPGQGKRRKIASVSRSAGTVTFSTTQVASDGGSGNITLSTNNLGIYVDSSYGNAPQGLGQAVATTGTFEGIDKATVTQWQGVSASPASTSALSDAILDNATYLARGNGVSSHDFGIAHPKVIDLYKQSKTSQVRYEPQEATLKSGYSGIVYQGADKPYPLIKDLAAPREHCRLVLKSVIQLYGDAVGPEFIADDGSMWRLFDRKSVKEADLIDRMQFGVKDCGKLVDIGSLSEAS